MALIMARRSIGNTGNIGRRMSVMMKRVRGVGMRLREGGGDFRLRWMCREVNGKGEAFCDIWGW